MPTRNILVTGGCGFVGRATANALADAGHAVTVVDIDSRPFRDDVTYLELDINDRSRLQGACAGMDSIVHAASTVRTLPGSRATLIQTNVGGTRNVLDACRDHGITRLVYVSSASVVYAGRDIEGGDERLPYAGRASSAYSATKIEAEKAVLAFGAETATRVCAIRPHIVYGPGDTRFLPSVLRRAAAGRLKREIGRRDKLSDFTFIGNVVDALVLAEAALEPGSPVCGQAYFVTDGEPRPMFGFIEELIVGIGYPPFRGSLPFWLAYAGAAAIEAFDALRPGGGRADDGDSRFAVGYFATHHYFRTDKARRDLGWEPRVPLARGLKLTIDAART